MEKPPQWRLPAGVSSGVWDYIHSDDVAQEYDAKLAGSPLFRLDSEFVLEHCPRPGRLIDLGCGTGRLLTTCSARGHWVLGVDLSAAMLEVARRRGIEEGQEVNLLQANLADLRCLADESFDYAACLFSTLGMIQGEKVRAQVVASAFRLLRPGGRFILHVHNRWFSLWDPAGRRWLLADAWKRMRGLPDFGDRPMPSHQGLAGLALHHFTRGELTRLLEDAGFRIEVVQAVGLKSDGTLSRPWLLKGLRAYGYLCIGVKERGRAGMA